MPRNDRTDGADAPVHTLTLTSAQRDGLRDAMFSYMAFITDVPVYARNGNFDDARDYAVRGTIAVDVAEQLHHGSTLSLTPPIQRLLWHLRTWLPQDVEALREDLQAPDEDWTDVGRLAGVDIDVPAVRAERRRQLAVEQAALEVLQAAQVTA